MDNIFGSYVILVTLTFIALHLYTRIARNVDPRSKARWTWA